MFGIAPKHTLKDGVKPVARDSNNDARVGLSYDNLFRLDSLDAGGIATPLRYDNDSLLTSAGELSVGRRGDNGLLGETTLQDLITATNYNAHAEPIEESAVLPGGGQFSMVYERDAVGRITKRTEEAPSGSRVWEYEYDQAGRLSEVAKDGEPYASYTYDLNGNRVESTIAGQTQTATFDNRDRMRTQGDFTYEYNLNGEMIGRTNTQTGKKTEFNYDTFGNLTGATIEEGSKITYKLDADANRATREVDGQTISQFIYAPGIQGPVAELKADNTLRARYVYATRSIVPDYMQKGGEKYRLLTDQLGSVRLVVNAQSGAVAQELEYDPFGKVIHDTNEGFQPFGFAGGLYDSATGLTHFGAREYDAAMGRWTAGDPISFAGGDSNLYGYVLSDPVNLVDPSGLISLRGVVDYVNGNDHLSYLSSYSAGVLNAMTVGLSNRLVGVSGQCAGRGYGFGSAVGTVGGISQGFGRTGKAISDRRAALFAADVAKTFAQHRVDEFVAISGYGPIGKALATDVGVQAGKQVADGQVRNLTRIDDGCVC